jgi:hypothetical protein
MEIGMLAASKGRSVWGLRIYQLGRDIQAEPEFMSQERSSRIPYAVGGTVLRKAPVGYPPPGAWQWKQLLMFFDAYLGTRTLHLGAALRSFISAVYDEELLSAAYPRYNVLWVGGCMKR